MASTTPAYITTRTVPTLPQLRYGGPRRSPRAERVNDFMNGRSSGSHMPIDAGIHWEWNNPLNIIPAFILLVILIALVGSVVSLLG